MFINLKKKNSYEYALLNIKNKIKLFNKFIFIVLKKTEIKKVLINSWN